MIKKIRLNLIERIKRTSTIKSFRFSAEQKINFIPGQFIKIIFDEANLSNKDINKCLSLSSSPSKGYIEITKRLSGSSFSEKLDSLKIGDNILSEGPLGNCVFKQEYKKIGFLIGGIGITAVISIIEDIMDKGIDTDVILLYSNKTSGDIAFKGELDNWQNYKNIKVVYVITGGEVKDSSYITGYIDKNLIIERISDLEDREFFVFGPPAMVDSMRSLCLEIGCQKQKVKTESFVGY